MAAGGDGQERTERATSKRIRDARKKGQVPRSRELNGVIGLLAASGGLLLLGQMMIDGVAGLMRSGLALERAQIFNPNAVLERLGLALWDALGVVAPMLALLVIAAFVGPLALGGWNLSTDAFGIKWGKLNPVTGLVRLFAWRGLLELAKALVKFVLVGGASVLLLWHLSGELLGIGKEPLREALAHAAHLYGWTFLKLSAVLILVAAVDVPFQLWDYARQLKMSRQEIKDEFKETEGRPEVKRRIRKMQLEMAQRRMMQEVPKADVVVTNPTHYAVALRYDQGRMKAPRVVAKGADLVAAEIRSVAHRHRVAIFRAPPLARALYFSTELNREIPAGLYLAVAQVLAYVYQLRTLRPQGWEPPAPPNDLAVPEEFLRRG